MKKTLLLFVFSIVLTNLGFSQTERAWTNYKGNDVKVAISAQRESFPLEFQLMKLDLSALRQVLFTASDRFAENRTSAVISLPNAEGKLERFRFYEASNFAPDLQAQFPEIRSYVGQGIDDKYATARLSIDPKGIQTMVFRVNTGTEFMEPYSEDGQIYAVYYSSRKKGKLPFTCSTPEQVLTNAVLASDHISARSSSGSLLTFRLALSCNGEYANYFGATSATQVALVLAQFNATMTRVNGVFEKDFAIHMNIVSQTTNVIFYSPTTDPYTTMSNWNTQLQQTLNTRLTGSGTTLAANNAAYDIGHMFGASGGGGNAGCIGCVCVNGVSSGAGSTKGRGITSPSDGVPQGDTFDIDYVAHEMGHQFGANHTFSSSSEGAGVNVEVGGGVTIMGYAGITNFNTHLNSIDIFHSASIAQVQANMIGKTCPTVTAISHSAPVVNAGADFIIPLSTPFVLTGSATDAGGTSLMKYTWEQIDDAETSIGANSPASVTKTIGPNFVCFPESSSPVRQFPIYSSVLNGSTISQGLGVTAEALSSVARALSFRLTARDNISGQGQTNFDDMVVTVDNKSPLTVTIGNNTSYPVGSTQTVVWTGATGATGHSTILGAANVDISFSADNGVNWTTLLTNTLNDGSEQVTLPAGIAAPFCRFRVKASGNIFYNVSQPFAVGYNITNTCNNYTMNTGFSIPDNDQEFTVRTINVPTSSLISDVNLAVNLQHTWVSDLQILLQGPMTTTTQSLIFSQACSNNDNINAVFDDQNSGLTCAATITGNVTPLTPLSVFNNLNPNGDWVIAIRDVGEEDTGNVVSYTLTVCSQLVTLSTESFEFENLAIYPNPNNGNFNIQFISNSSNEINVGVHDMRGREIFTNKYSNNGLFNENLQLSNVQSGIYLVTIQDGSSKVTKKIVIE